MAKFRDIKTLQKFASVHASIHNHFNLYRHLNTARGSSPVTTPAKPSTVAKTPGSRCLQAPSSSAENSSAASGRRVPKRQAR